MKRMAFVLGVLLVATRCEAALFSGPAVFSATPSSQLGPVTSSLVITNTTNGFIVTGTVSVTVPATTSQLSGILATWVVDRPLDPTYGSGTLTTTTIVNGTSSPPIGIFGFTTGKASSEFSNVGAASESYVGLSLINGLDIPPWTGLTATSSP
ncbi:MAG: hypothetical protein JSS02_33810, partial [Planctomycetes bacterium]|nr:hypothetical protein [Planctomycetota bacterium]